MTGMPTVAEGPHADLIKAASKGDAALARSLLAGGADVRAKDRFGNTALIYAALGGHTEVVRLLLESGADPLAANQIGMTAPKLAAAHGHSEIVELFESHKTTRPPEAFAGAETRRGTRSLHRAAHEGDVAGVSALLAGGADANARDDDRWTPLMFAAVKGHAGVVRALLGGGANANARNAKGWTALTLAVSVRDPEMMQLLLGGGADADTRDDEGRTPLMRAAEENNVECLKVLLAHGVDVNARSVAGETASALAARHAHAEVLRLLEEAGARDAAALLAAPASAQAAFDPTNVESLFNSRWLEPGAEKSAVGDEESAAGVEETQAAVTPVVSEPPPAESQALAPAQARPEAVERLIAALEGLREFVPAVSAANLSHKLMLTLPEAAVLTGLSRTHLRQAVREGRLKARIIGRKWLIKRADLDEYVRNL